MSGGALAGAGLLERDEPGRITTSPAPTASAAREGAPAGILYIDSDKLAVADPDAGRPQAISVAFPTSQQRTTLAVSAARTAAVTEDGSLVALDRAGLATPQRIVPADLEDFTVHRGGWAADGAALAFDVRQGAAKRVGLLTLATGSVAMLADGINAAGDPRTPGAAYAAGVVERTFQASSVESFQFADAARVERRAPSLPPVTLLTREDFLRLMGLPVGTPTDFTNLTWSPDGERLALTGVAMHTAPKELEFAAGRWGVAVLSRNGQVESFQALPPRHFVGSMAWSPGGDQLVFSDFESVSHLQRPTAKLRSWSYGTGRPGVLTEIKVPEGQQPFSHGECMWSPDGARLLCGDDRAWYTIPVTGGTAGVAETVPGRPAAWLGT